MPLILPKRRGLIRASGPLTGMRPGFDPAHIAAGSVTFSAVSLGGYMTEIRTGRKPSTNNGTPTPTILPIVGATTKYVASGDYQLFSGNPSGIETICTMAGIFMITGSITAGFHYLMENGSGTRAVGVYWDNTGKLVFDRYGLTATPSTTLNAIVAGVPYFVCASSDSTTQTNFLLKRLDNGVTSMQSVASASAPGSGNGTMIIGNSANLAAETPNGGIAAVMFSRVLFTLAMMQKWADDPWSFWYPR